MNLLRIRLKTLLVAMVPVAMITALALAVFRVRTAGKESQCISSLKFMSVYLLNYRDATGHFPTVAFQGAGTKPLYGWRVLLHDVIDRECGRGDFGRAFHFDQPWNSPANLLATAVAPSLFVCLNNQRTPHRLSNYVAVIDRGVSSLERANPIKTDSPEAARTVLLIEYPNSDIIWTEPRDLDIDDLGRLSAGSDPRGVGVVFVDTHIERVSLDGLRKLLGH